jgi:hypothetical protein
MSSTSIIPHDPLVVWRRSTRCRLPTRMTTTRDIITRCDRDAERLEVAGHGEAANTMYMAARELERLMVAFKTQETA